MNLRRVVVGAAALIALQVFATQTKTGEALGMLPGFLNRLSSPDVALIKNRGATSSSSTSTGGTLPSGSVIPSQQIPHHL